MRKYNPRVTDSCSSMRQYKWKVSTSHNSPFLMRQYKWRVSTSRNSQFINLKIRGELQKVGLAIRNSPFFPVTLHFFVTLHLYELERGGHAKTFRKIKKERESP